MPRGDGTGPRGRGSKQGRGMGICRRINATGSEGNDNFPRGQNSGRGRGRGTGRGTGRSAGRGNGGN